MKITPIPRAAMASVTTAPAPFMQAPDRPPVCRDGLRAIATDGDLAMHLPRADLQSMAEELLLLRALDARAAICARALDNIDAIARAMARCFSLTGCAAHGLRTDTVVAVLADELQAMGYGDITGRDIHMVFRRWDADPMARVWLDTNNGHPILRGLRSASVAP